MSDDRSYCLARSPEGFICCLRKHEKEHPHISFDNRGLDVHGRPGMRLQWGGQPEAVVPVTVDHSVPSYEFPGQEGMPAPSAGKALKKLRASTVAREMGYSGIECGSCGSMNTKQNGSCLVCVDCKETSGCS